MVAGRRARGGVTWAEAAAGGQAKAGEGRARAMSDVGVM